MAKEKAFNLWTILQWLNQSLTFNLNTNSEMWERCKNTEKGDGDLSIDNTPYPSSPLHMF